MYTTPRELMIYPQLTKVMMLLQVVNIINSCPGLGVFIDSHRKNTKPPRKLNRGWSSCTSRIHLPRDEMHPCTLTRTPLYLFIGSSISFVTFRYWTGAERA